MVGEDEDDDGEAEAEKSEDGFAEIAEDRFAGNVSGKKTGNEMGQTVSVGSFVPRIMTLSLWRMVTSVAVNVTTQP